jgi:hypothetical protein
MTYSQGFLQNSAQQYAQRLLRLYPEEEVEKAVQGTEADPARDYLLDFIVCTFPQYVAEPGRKENDELEQQVELRNKAIETVAELQKEAKPMYKLTKMVLDIARDTPARTPATEQRPVEGRKEQQQDPPGLLTVYMNDLDQPADTDARRQAIHENRRRRANFNAQTMLKALAEGSAYDQAMRGEAPAGDPNTPGTAAWKLAHEREQREREERERTKPRRHLYSDGS